MNSALAAINEPRKVTTKNCDQKFWIEYDKEIKVFLDKKKRVKDIWEDDRAKRNYFDRMNSDNVRK